jgi:phosphoglucan,water dikinase
LTRIRDIAHRGDIPQEMKSEIKNRLQNKLHRSADPGDLKTCEELIHKMRNGQYSEAFKKEFEIFYEELKEFFNAVGLEKLLD